MRSKLKFFIILTFLNNILFHINLYCLSEKPLAIVVTSYNNAKWYKVNLDSIYKQNYSNYKVISILTSHSEYITDEDREFLREMKAKYQWGKYEVSHLYQHSSEKLKIEYRSLHQNICHLLYD